MRLEEAENARDKMEMSQELSVDTSCQLYTNTRIADYSRKITGEGRITEP